MKMVKIPYGISNFAMMREDKYLYVDKTRYIEVLENYPPYQFFIRPRRFGKSLFISMLEHYYDINKANDFDKLFGGTYIHQHITEKRNSYLVLRLSFSSIVTSEGIERLMKSFDDNVLIPVRSFVSRYSSLLGNVVFPVDIRNAESAIKFIIQHAHENGQQLLLLIDEYDNFANDLIGRNRQELYLQLLSSEGYVRNFYKAIKDGTMSSVARVFITGVSPLMLDDLTSGFNITHNLTLKKQLNEMLGLTQGELQDVIDQLALPPGIDIARVYEDMQYHYNGYLFSDEATQRLYNPDMVLYFLENLQREGKYPRHMLDDNVKTDYRKLRTLAMNFSGKADMDKILQDETTVVQLVERFHLEDMYDKPENFVSMLYYIGMLTIKEGILNKTVLGVPNYVIRKIYWEYFTEQLTSVTPIHKEAMSSSITEMRERGNISLFTDELKKNMEVLSNRDLMSFSEKAVKLLICALISADDIYVIRSEMEVNTGYIDIMLTRDVRYAEYTKYEWLIELKYLKESERSKLEEVKQAGLAQLARYSESELITRGFSGESLKKILLVVVGKTDIYMEEL